MFKNKRKSSLGLGQGNASSSNTGTHNSVSGSPVNSGRSSVVSGNSPQIPTDPNESLRRYFDQHDVNRNGRLSEDELVYALQNYDKSNFNISTVRQMIKLFDIGRQGSLDFGEFRQLWQYLNRWKAVFEKFDVDRSMSISLNEYANALAALGFSLEQDCLRHIFTRFSYVTPSQGQVMKLDSFVESMVWVMQITEDFKRFPSSDPSHRTAVISFSQFLDVVLRHRG